MYYWDSIIHSYRGSAYFERSSRICRGLSSRDKRKMYRIGIGLQNRKKFTTKELIKKVIAMIVFTVLFSFVVHIFNGADTFIDGFVDSYIIWLAVDWYDAIVLDCIWFCHSKNVMIKGTEDMKEYKDFLFHIEQSCIGMLLGLPVCAAVGALVMFFKF